MKDFFKKSRGKCLHEECSSKATECPEYILLEDIKSAICHYCGHYARNHEILDDESIEEPPLKKLCTSDSNDVKNSTNEEDNETGENTYPGDNYDKPSTSGVVMTCTNAASSLSEVGWKVEKGKEEEDKKQELFNYIPPNFSSYVLPLLNGDKTVSEFKMKKMKNQLIREIQVYLDENDLINFANSKSNKKEYSILAAEFLKKFPSFQWCESKRMNSHPCQTLVSRLSSRRRQNRYHKRKLSVIVLNPENALEKLEGLLINEVASPEVIDLLKRSYSLRERNYPSKLSFYLRTKDNILCEISLRIGLDTDTSIIKLQSLVKKFRGATGNSSAGIEDVEEYFKTSASSAEKFLSVTTEGPTMKPTKKHGPCVIFVAEQNACYLYDMGEKVFNLISGHFTLLECVLIGFGSYFIYNVKYPLVFGQFLGLLEIILKRNSISTISSYEKTCKFSK